MNNQYFMGGVQRGLSGIGAGTGLYGLAGMAQQGQQQGGGSNTTDSQQQTASLPQQTGGGMSGSPVQMPSSGGGFPFWEIPTDQLFPQYPQQQGIDPPPGMNNVTEQTLPYWSNPSGMPLGRLQQLVDRGINTPATEGILGGQYQMPIAPSYPGTNTYTNPEEKQRLEEYFRQDVFM